MSPVRFRLIDAAVVVISTSPPAFAPRPLPLTPPIPLAALLVPRVSNDPPRPRFARTRVINADLDQTRPRPALPLTLPPLARPFPLAIPRALPRARLLPDPLPRPCLAPLAPLPVSVPRPRPRPRPLRLEIRVLASATLMRARLWACVGGRDRSALAALMSAIFLASFSNFRFCAFNSLFLR